MEDKMNKHEEAIQKLDFMNDEYNKLLERFNLSGGFGNWYLGVKRVLKEAEATEKELIKQKRINELLKGKINQFTGWEPRFIRDNQLSNESYSEAFNRIDSEYKMLVGEK